MGVGTVFRDDLRNARRSKIVVGVVGVFTLLSTLIFVSEINIFDDAVRSLFDLTALVAFLFPLFVASLTYLAVAGDRARGSIKYVLGLPNERWEYALGKYLSRGVVAVTAVLGATLVGFVVGAVAFTNGADPERFLTFGLVSSLYALSLTGVFVGLSAMTASRSRAMFAAIGAFFVLVPFWNNLLPVLQVGTVIDFAETLFGITVSEETRLTIAGLSPSTAYLSATAPVFEGAGDQYEVVRAVIGGDTGSLADELWFNLLVLVGWGGGVPLVGYLRFRRAELG